MATQLTPEQMDADERHVRLSEMIANADKLILEGQKLAFERNKLEAERMKMEAERLEAGAETEFMPRAMIFQAMLAGAALIGAGAAIAKLLFP